MTHSYNISGMTCGSCVAKVKSKLLMTGDVSDATVQLASPQAVITMQKHVPTEILQAAISNAGNYTITEANVNMNNALANAPAASWIQTYKPILLIGAFISGVTLLIEFSAGHFNLHRWMPNFMAAFFLVFSFFKFLDLKGFAESYAGYDIVAKGWTGWGYLYPFIELGLGIAFLLRWNPFLTNLITLVVMSVSIIGVLQSVFNKKKIQCACLGAVFQLPMSTITIIEDFLMIGMSAAMLLTIHS